MSFNPCAVVPCYNHGAAVGGVSRGCVRRAWRVLLVDDGSDAQTARVLDVLPGIQLFRLPQNRGKGAAVVHGLREAHRWGLRTRCRSTPTASTTSRTYRASWKAAVPRPMR
jgi:glycosyltransferase involved in cell wall biosynthesis